LLLQGFVLFTFFNSVYNFSITSEVPIKALIAALLMSSFSTYSAEVPATPPNPCYRGCTQAQKQLVTDFFTNGVEPQKLPAVYSGVCHHIGQYDPEYDHHAIVLIDEENAQSTFATIFAWFGNGNAFKDWNLAVARLEMSPYWREYGKLTFAEHTGRVVVYDDRGLPVYVYWMRQNPVTKELLYITYMGQSNKAFCRLQQHRE
jgi:hypothetical protein